MAAHNIHAKVDMDIKRFREMLKTTFADLSWEFSAQSENYYKVRLIHKNISDQLGVIPGQELADYGLNAYQRLEAQFSAKINQGLNAIMKRFSLLKKTMEASEKFMKGVIDLLGTDNFYPEIIIIPNGQQTDLTISLKSWEAKSSSLILTYLILKNHLHKEYGVAFAGYEYLSKEAKSAKSAPAATEETSGGTQKEDSQATPLPGPSEELLAFATKLKIKISENEIQTCFQEMDDLYERIQGELFGDYLVLKSDYSRLERDVITGVVSYQDAELRRNQINHRFLQLIDLLDEDDAILRNFR